MSETRPAYPKMRLVVEALAAGPESIRARVRAASRVFPAEDEMSTRAEKILHLRIGAALVEGGPEGFEGEEEDDERSVAESVADLDEHRLAEIAGDMLLLYEHTAGVRPDERWPGLAE